MGFEVFLSCYEQGECAEFPAAVLEDLWATVITRREPIREGERWVLNYPCEIDPDEPTTVLFQGRECPVIREDATDVYIRVDEAGMTDGFMVAGPPGHDDFYASLLAILRRTNTALYCAGLCPPLVGHAGMMAHLPPDMIEALGQPVLLTTPGEIIERFKAS